MKGGGLLVGMERGGYWWGWRGGLLVGMEGGGC